MAFDSFSDPFVRFALLTAAAALLLSAATTLSIAVLRARFALRARREARFTARWRPLLLESVDAIPAHLPTVKRPDRFAFLSLWNHFQESLRGPARHRLSAIALRLRMDVAARELLEGGGTRERLMAAVTLGQLGDADSWPALEKLAAGAHSPLSLAAARALMQIDAPRALAVLLPDFTSRQDWPLARLQSILAEAGPEAVSRPLSAAVDTTPPRELPRLIALLDAADARVVSPKIRALLESSRDEEVLAACLKSRHVPRDRDLLLRFAQHERWHIRTQAARALGFAARPGDEKLLVSMLSDPVWWVRYRAAQALAGLPFLSRQDIWRLRLALTDRFAQNVLDQVVAERTGGL
ncbi:MAG TPA: HEAT repeat domain-containing protein [Burkholderiales bacterium]|nr:HEAT repeat domain-containing protein [Burkholderiales bacterium]